MNKSLSDVNVILDVLQPAIPENLGKLAVFVKSETAPSGDGETPQAASTSASIQAFTDVEELLNKVTNKDVQNLAKGYFNQSNHGEEFYVISYSDLTAALDGYFGEGWEFATVVGDEADSAVLSNYVEGKGTKFAVVGLEATDANVEAAETFNQTYIGNKRTIAFMAGTGDDTKYAVGALIGKLGNETVGAITWKFKTLNGVKAIDFTKAQIDKLHKNGIFTYVNKAGIDQTSDGITIGGEFIDALHGDDWVKASIENNVQNLLTTSGKVTFDSSGIAQIDGVVTSVLQDATTNGIVLIDAESGQGQYTVTAQSRADTPAEDIAQRHYNGLSFSYTRAGAIHSVTVHGTVSL